MLLQRDLFFQNAPAGIGICGLYLSRRGSFHVGLYCNWEGIRQVIHFVTHNDIRVEDVSAVHFNSYYFIPIADFPYYFIDSLLGVIDAMAFDPHSGLYIDIESILYNGGRFEISTVKYLNQTDVTVNVINCSVFVLALLQTYDYNLLDWETWPPVPANKRNRYLEDWLDRFQVPAEDREPYYNFNKEIRGRHVLSAPLAKHHPVPFSEADLLSEQLLKSMNN